MAEEFIMTQKGYDEAVERLKYLQTEKKKEITERIKVARGFGDLSENAEYDAAKNEQAMIEGEILEIEEKIKHAKVFKAGKKGMVSLGSKVEVYDRGYDEVCVYEIVGTTEADLETNRISNESPIGNALLGRKAGDVVEVAVPEGTAVLEIRKVY